MNDARATSLPPEVQTVLARYRRRRRTIHAVSGVLLALGVAVAAVTIGVAADRWFRLPETPRTAWLALAVGATAGILLARAAWPAIRRYGDRKAALDLGRSCPAHAEDLLSAVELAEGDAPAHSRSLVDSALAGIAARTSAVDPRRGAPARPLAALAGLVLVPAAALAIAWLVQPEAVGNALVRVLAPGRDVPWFSYTTVTATSGDRVIARGDAVELTAMVTGEVPETAQLEIDSDGRVVSLVRPIVDGRAAFRSGPLLTSLRYRFEAGDGRSEWRSVRVVAPPRVARIGARITWPDYAGRPPETVDSLPSVFETLAGARLLLEFVAEARGDDPRLAVEGELAAAGEPGRRLVRGAAGHPTATVEAKARREYEIHLTDGYGLTNRPAERLVVIGVADASPRVAITTPRHDLVVLPDARIPIAAEGRDDYGLRYLKLELQHGRAGETARPTELSSAEGGPTVEALTGEAVLDLPALGAAPGDLLVLQAVTSDYAGEAFSREVRSEPVTIVVISEAEHVERLLAEAADLKLDLLRLAAREAAEAARAESAAKAAADADVSDEARAARTRQEELAREVREVAAKAERLAAEMAANPSADAQTLADLSRLAEALRDVAGDPMADASAKMGEAADRPPGESAEARAGRQSEAMGKASAKAGEAARDLERLAREAAALKNRSELERMAAKAEALAARQREIGEAADKTAVHTAGADAEDLPEGLAAEVGALAEGEAALGRAVVEFQDELRDVAHELAPESESDAEVAEAAADLVEQEKLADRAADLAAQMGRNQLFRTAEGRESVAKSLDDVAELLRGSVPGAENVEKQIDEFIRRQKAINAAATAAIAKKKPAFEDAGLARPQAALAGAVEEQASALASLAREFEGFDGETADLLERAAAEMRPGAERFFAGDREAGLEHGKRALAWLEKAAETAPSEAKEAAEAKANREMILAAMEILRLLAMQGKVNAATEATDRLPADAEAERRARAAGLALDQRRIRQRTGELSKTLARLLPAALPIVDKAAEEMETSAEALAAGEVGAPTRVVQRRIVALLEALFGDCQGACSGGASAAGLAGLQRMLAAASAPGGGSGGFTGGSNQATRPGETAAMDDEEWRRTRDELPDDMSSGGGAEVPVRYRSLVDAYFETIRRAEPR